jgi:glycosyltransferase involved in cell wall biosynthesis
MKSGIESSPVALLAQGGPDWIAGRIYICNLVRALNLLPNEERIPFRLVLPHTSQSADLVDMGTNPLAARYFAFRATDRVATKLRSALRSLRRGRWPRSLEDVVVRAKARAVFPCTTSLGREFPAPWIGWIPDFQHKRLPRFFSEAEQRERDASFQDIADNACHVVVSSQDALHDLMQWFPVRPTRASVLSFVSVLADEWYEEEPDRVAARFQLPEKFLIFPSQFWIHKNHRILFEAIRLLRDKGLADICLVSTGQTNDYRHPEYFAGVQDFLVQHGLAAHVRILGLLPRKAQIHLMRRAVAVIQPSLFEGWSALVEDARSLGKRIYVSDIPVHREEHPADAVFFDPDRADQLAELVARDWPDLRPGPDLAREREACSQAHSRALAFAGGFLQILDRATANEKEKPWVYPQARPQTRRQP